MYDAITEATALAKAGGWDARMIGEPIPAGDALFRMAKQLARPVARGQLRLSLAYAALIAATLKAERTGELGAYKASHIVSGLRHALRSHLDNLCVDRELVGHRICRMLSPMIEQHKPSNALLAEAHGMNGESGFPFSEPEVTDLVTTEVYYSLPLAPRGRRHAR